MGQRLTGKIALISGGISSFREAQATLYGCDGANVIVGDQHAAVVELLIGGRWQAAC